MGIPIKVGSWFVGLMALMSGAWALREYVVGGGTGAAAASTSIEK